MSALITFVLSSIADDKRGIIVERIALLGRANPRCEGAERQEVLPHQVAQLGRQDLHMGGRGKHIAPQTTYQGVHTVPQVRPAVRWRAQEAQLCRGRHESLRRDQDLRPCAVWRRARTDLVGDCDRKEQCKGRALPRGMEGKGGPLSAFQVFDRIQDPQRVLPSVRHQLLLKQNQTSRTALIFVHYHSIDSH